MSLNCKYLEVCRGCPLGGMEYEQQKNHKKKMFLDRLENHLSPAARKNTQYEFVFPVFDHYRTRSDFIFQNGQLGWYTAERQFLAIEECTLQTRELNEFAQMVGKLDWPIQKGSMRFRVAPDGKRGLWLDLANVDIKTILSAPTLLPSLIDQGIVIEMGQKGKQVIQEDQIKFVDPIPYPWFATEYENKSVPLKTLISSFTQTNPILNVHMIQLVKKYLHPLRFDQIIEFGSGTGNFTLFLTELSREVLAIENDRRNLLPLRQNLADLSLSHHVKIIETVQLFLSQEIHEAATRLYFVNPARSGVGSLFDRDVMATDVIYISCHLDSFIRDAEKLDTQGFQLVQATLFDQFPHSAHFEIVSFFKKAT
ncbi:MAG: class I SAM-dependent RNA methyltransferase [Bdellovibrionaceae bacterium]|nr:class I SAM-dependent RNA methyltransferase [Pseudobdellovibrionaceae bacterium]